MKKLSTMLAVILMIGVSSCGYSAEIIEPSVDEVMLDPTDDDEDGGSEGQVPD